jgi:hypothetical protein
VTRRSAKEAALKLRAEETRLRETSQRRQMLADEVEFAVSLDVDKAPAAAASGTAASATRDAKAEDALIKKIKPHLAIAFLDPGLKSWSLQDPDFAPIRRSESFKEIARTPIRTDAWTLPPFAPMKAKAAELGYDTPAELALLVSSETTAEFFGIPYLAFAHKVRLAGFLQRATDAAAPDPAIKSVLLELFAGLLDAGVSTTGDLTSEWLDQGTIATKPNHPLIPILRKVNTGFGKSIDLPNAIDWVNRMVAPGYKRPTAPKPPARKPAGTPKGKARATP